MIITINGMIRKNERTEKEKKMKKKYEKKDGSNKRNDEQNGTHEE